MAFNNPPEQTLVERLANITSFCAGLNPSEIGAAAAGANSDITSLTGLTTPLAVAEGGTGSTTAAAALAALGAAPLAAPTFTGTVKLSLLLPSVLYSAAGTPLPAASDAIKGETAVVSDATTPTYLGAYVSGGAIICRVICQGISAGWVTC